MPDSNNPLETALRNIRMIYLERTNQHMDPGMSMLVRAELVNFRNLEVDQVIANIAKAMAPRDHGEA